MTLYNLVRAHTATLGTADIVVGAAVDGYLDFSQVANGATVSYGLHEGSNTEVGRGTWNSATSTLARTTVLKSTNADAKIVLAGSAQVYVTALAEDIPSAETAASILAKLITVDGAGSGLDADLLDGQSSAAFEPADATIVKTGNANWIDLTDGGATTLHSHAGGAALPVADTQTIVSGSADATKLLRFEVDGFTTLTTRVITPPDADLTLAGQNYANVFTANQKVFVANQSATLTDITQAVTKHNLLITTNHVGDAYSAGLMWSAADNNPTKPKAGIYMKTTGSGTQIHFGTSGLFATGITTGGNVMIDQGGRLVIGSSELAGTYLFHLIDTSGASTRGMAIGEYFSGVQAALVRFERSRGSYASKTAVASGDFIGLFEARPHDGTDFNATGYFGFKVSGAVSTGVVPTDFFVVTSDVNSTTAVRLNIDYLGTSVFNPVGANATTTKTLVARATASQTANVFEVQASTAAVHNSLTIPGASSAQENVFNETGSQYLDFRVETDSYNALFVDASNESIVIMSNAAGKVGFYGATAVAQPAGIADADGTLADITTKFNSLIGKLETLGLIATV